MKGYEGRGKGRKAFAAFALAACMVFTSSGAVFAEIPHAYWQYQQPFLDAAAAGNHAEIVRVGTEIAGLFANAPLDQNKAEILYATYDKMIPAYEKLGQYDKAIACLKAQIPYGEYLGFSDGVKLATERIRKIDPMTEVYALTGNIAALPYYGAKYEPRGGAYLGRVQSKDGEAAKETESVVSFYVECLQDNIAEYDYLIRPYADGKRVIHIAFNMPEENTSLQKVVDASADAYLNAAMEYIGSLDAPVMLRIGAEMDVWQNQADAALFKQAYIKIANLAKSKAPNAALVFSPNFVSSWNVNQEDYYPGDAYVDWVGVSLYYNKYRNAANPAAAADHEEMFYSNGAYSHPIQMLRKIVDCYGDRKPILITEGGAGNQISGKSTDLTGFAQSRVKELYTYVNMVYPQVKGAIYFDTDLGRGNEYVYALSKNQAVKATYQAATAANAGFLKSVGDIVSAYVKAGDYTDGRAELSLYAYCMPPGDQTVTVQYFLDGAAVASPTQIPYPCTIQAGSLSAGTHELKVTFAASGGYQKTKLYTLTKDAGGIVQIREQ